MLALLIIALAGVVLAGIIVPLALILRVYDNTFVDDALRAAERLLRSSWTN